MLCHLLLIQTEQFQIFCLCFHNKLFRNKTKIGFLLFIYKRIPYLIMLLELPELINQHQSRNDRCDRIGNRYTDPDTQRSEETGKDD